MSRKRGKTCEQLSESPLLSQSCSLATLTDAAHIGATAKGTVNTESSPAFEALIWRAVLTRNPEFCRAGGLLDPELDTCRAAVVDGLRIRSDAGVEVTVTPR